MRRTRWTLKGDPLGCLASIELMVNASHHGRSKPDEKPHCFRRDAFVMKLGNPPTKRLTALLAGGDSWQNRIESLGAAWAAIPWMTSST